MIKKIIKCGIMSPEDFEEMTIKIAKGEYKPEPDAPKIWFESLQTMAQLLSKENMHLLKVIDETEPESITALAQATGRKKNNLSRTLRKMQRYGILELKQRNRCVKPVVKVTDFRIEYGLNTYPLLSHG